MASESYRVGRPHPGGPPSSSLRGEQVSQVSDQYPGRRPSRSRGQAVDARKAAIAAMPFLWHRTCHEGCHRDRKSTRLNSSHLVISYAVFCLKKKKTTL